MPGLDVAAYDAVLKDDYEKTLITLFSDKVKTLQYFSKESGTWEGRQVIYPLNIDRNQGVMFTAENGRLPDAGAQQYTQTIIPIRFCHGRVQLSIQVMKASRSSKGAFKRAMDQEMRGLVRDLTRDRNRVMFGDGTGTMALVNGAGSGSTTLTVDAPGGVAGSVNGNRFLQKNMAIAIIDGGAITAVRSITAINANGLSVTLNATVSAGQAPDNAKIVRAAAVDVTALADTAYNREAMGLLGLIDDSTYINVLHNVNRTTYPIFKSQVFASVGALSADILQRGIDTAYELADGEISALLCHSSVRRAYVNLMEADRRYMAGSLRNPDLGTTAAKQGELDFGGIPFMIDRDAPYGTIFGIDKNGATRWAEVEGEWADDDGTILMRLTNVDAYEGRYRIFDNFSHDRPNSCVRWDGVTATVVVAHPI